MDKNNSFLFSVLIANYNNGAYLESAIQSVFLQTYSHWEIVIVDDCSTDNSMELYKKYENDNRIHIYINEKNHGCGYTKRRCVELASGIICGFLDPDDTLEPKALDIMINEHLKDETVSMVYSRYNEVDNNFNFIQVSTIQQVIPEDSSFLEFGCISHFVSFKSSLYRRTSGIDKSFLRAVDHDLYYKLEEVGKVKFVDEVLYNYRTNTGQNISLGKNVDNAYLWDVIGRIDARRRRELPIEDTVFDDLRLWGESKANEKIRNSLSFKIGNFLLTPFRWLSPFLNKFSEFNFCGKIYRPF